MAPRTFLFDLDGTLVDSVADLTSGVNLLRAELDLPPLEAQEVRGYVGDGASLLVRRSLPEGRYAPEHLCRFLELYGERLLENTLPYDGILDVLEAWRDHPMAVVTNKPIGLSLKLLEGLDLLRFFPVIVGGDSCGSKKPAPEPLLYALDRLKSPKGDAVMIGDHHTDLHAGRAAGVQTCFCTWGIGSRGDAPYDFLARRPEELFRLFQPEVR